MRNRKLGDGSKKRRAGRDSDKYQKIIAEQLVNYPADC